MGDTESKAQEEPNAVLDRGQRLERWTALWKKNPEAALREIENEAVRLTDKVVAQFDETKTDDVLESIKTRRSNLDVKPEFTPTVISACQQILAFGGAGLAVVATFSGRLVDLNWSATWVKVLAVLASFYLNLIIVAFITLVWFFIQARTRYPFLFLQHLGNAVPYFYYRTLSRDHTWWPVRTWKGIARANAQYLDDLVAFVEYHANEDKRSRLKSELCQYFLLIVYQGYLDQFEMQLVHLFLFGLIGNLIASLSILFIL
jgi:hypothetical protein